ncbi:MAG: DTW domain-containing protein [Pseudomonadota bacterium]
MNSFTNQFHLVRAQCLAESTTPFLARGKSVTRCDSCQMASFACLCAWRPRLQSRCEFILLMHRIEVFKPTNTGRLIADVLPEQTHVFCWSRTEPAKELLALLRDKNRQCFIVFPADPNMIAEGKVNRKIVNEIPGNKKIPTFILLDGTWKQSGRMFHLSRWLDDVACISLSDVLLGDYVKSYTVRKSHQDSYLSTAEAAALCLELIDEQKNSAVLLNYFQLFNLHYLATRACCPPEIGALHKLLVSSALSNY